MTQRGERIALLGILGLAAALRLPALDRIPNGLIPDEALSAYDAFSIASTGRDAYGERLPLFPRSTARLHCLYIYLAVPFVAAHGLDEWSARLPSALAGILTVAIVFLWLREAYGVLAGLAAALLLAVSPWHILMSRTGHDWNLVPLMAALTAWLLTRALTRGASLWPAALSAGISFYTYTPMRLWMPLLLLVIAVTHAEPLRRQWRRALPAAVLLALLAAPPLIATAVTDEGRQRLSTVAAASNDGESAFAGFLGRFASSFSPRFLLAPATEPALHRLRSTGLLHGFEAMLALAGAAACVARRERTGFLPLLAALAAPLAVSMHRDAPDPILDIVMLPWLQALGGIGAGWLIGLSSGLRPWARVALLAAAAAWAGVSVARLSFDLHREFPVYAAPAWGYGVREAVVTLERARARGGHDDVLVDTGEKLIGSLILFYTRYEPRARHAEVRELPGRAERSRAGVYWIGALEDAAHRPGRHLVWTTAGGAKRLQQTTPIARIRLPDGREHYVLLSISGASGGR